MATTDTISKLALTAKACFSNASPIEISQIARVNRLQAEGEKQLKQAALLESIFGKEDQYVVQAKKAAQKTFNSHVAQAIKFAKVEETDPAKIAKIASMDTGNADLNKRLQSHTHKKSPFVSIFNGILHSLIGEEKKGNVEAEKALEDARQFMLTRTITRGYNERGQRFKPNNSKFKIGKGHYRTTRDITRRQTTQVPHDGPQVTFNKAVSKVRKHASWPKWGRLQLAEAMSRVTR